MLKQLVLICVFVGVLAFGGQGFVTAQDTSVSAISYSADGHYLAIGYDSGLMAVYEVTGIQLGALVFEAQPDSYVRSLEWNPVYPSQLFYAGGEGPIFVYDVEAQPGEELIALKEVYGYGFLYAEWLKDGDHIITNPNQMSQNSVTIVSVSSEESVVLDMYALITSTADFTINPEGTKVLIRHVHDCFHNQAYVRSLTDLTAPIEREFLDGSRDRCIPVGAVWTTKALLLLIEDDVGDGYIEIYNPYTYEKGATYKVEYGFREFALRSGTSQITILTDKGKGELKIFDWIDQQFVATVETSGMVRGLAWSPDGRYLAYSADGSVYIREIPLPVEQAPSPTATPLVLGEVTPVLFPSPYWTPTPEATADR